MSAGYGQQGGRFGPFFVGRMSTLKDSLESFIYTRCQLKDPKESFGAGGFFWRCTLITELMINDQIRDKEVRLIDADGTQLGIVAGREAQRLSDEKRLDLVKISPTAKPPVCKIMDYSKYKFDQSKKEKEARKRQKTIEVKELRLSPNIDEHDIEVKIKKALEFLGNGDKVKVTIRFRGREIGRSEIAYGIMRDFAEKINQVGSVEKPPRMEGKTMAMFLSPKI